MGLHSSTRSARHGQKTVGQRSGWAAILSRGQSGLARSLSLGVGSSIFILSAFLCHTLAIQEKNHIDHNTQLTTAVVKSELTQGINEQVLALVEMAKVWEKSGQPTQKSWEAEAKEYLEQFNCYQAIEWVDPSFQVRWMVTRLSQDPVTLPQMSDDPVRLPVLQAAQTQHQIRITPTLNGFGDHKGFEVYVPIFRNEIFEGFIVGVLSAQELFTTVVAPNHIPGYAIAILDTANQELYRTPHLISTAEKWRYRDSIEMNGAHWYLQVTPNTQTLLEEDSCLPEVILVMGSVVAIALSLSIHLAQREQQRVKELAKINQKLEQEISDRSLAEAALRESQKRYRCLLELSPAAIIVQSDEKFVYLNVAATQLLGAATAEELLGQSIFKIIPPGCQEFLKISAEDFQNSPKSAEFIEEKLLALDGTTIDVEVSIIPITYGGKFATQMMIRDIRQRKQMEAERMAWIISLQESEKRFRAIAEGILLPVIISRVSDGLILYINPEASQLFGVSPSAAVGQLTQDFYYQIADREKLLSQLATTGWVKNYEVQAKKKDGTSFWILVSIQPLNLNGEKVWLTLCYDITERKLAEEAITRSQQEYETLVNWIDGIVWEMETQAMRLTFVSQQAEKLLGYPVENWLTEPFFWENHIHPEDRDWAIQFCAFHVQNKKDFDFEYRMIAVDGSTVWLRDIVSVVLENDQPVKIRGVMLDITKYKEAEAALRASEERYRSVITAMAEGIVVQDKTGKIIANNASAEQILGVSTQELLERNSFDTHWKLIYEDGSPFQGKHHPAMITLETGQPQSNVVMGVYKPDGNLGWISINSQPIFCPGENQPYAVVTSFSDISDRKRAEEALRRQALIFETISDGAIVTDLQANVIDCNPAAEKIFGYTKSEVIGKPVQILHRPQATPLLNHQQIFEKVLQEGRWSGELEFIRKDGREGICETVIVPLRNEQDKISATLGIHRDITERKRAEAALQESQHFVQRIADASPNILYIYDLQEKANFYVNREIWMILGYTPKEIQALGKELFTTLMHPDDLVKMTEKVQEFDTAKDGDIIESEYRMRHKNNHWCWFYSRDTIFSRTPDGQPKQILGTATDISDRKRVEEELQQANTKLTLWVNQLEQHNREMALLTEMRDVLQACLSVEEAYNALDTLIYPLFPGCSGAVLMMNASNNLVEAVATWGESLSTQMLFSPQDCWALRRGRLHWVKNTRSGLACKHLHRDTLPTQSLCIPMMAQGETLGILSLSTPQLELLSEGKQRLAATVAEYISLALANLKLRETLQHQSIRDPLTGLFNRRYLEESLERELRRAERNQQPLGIIMLDVDHFKQFNDTFGHEAGDTVLRELGRFLQKYVRASDIACRYGGEELILILPEASLEETKRRAEQLRQGVKLLNLQHHHQPLSAIALSVGVACFPNHGLNAQALIRAADNAMYRAKKEGRDRVVTA